MAENAIAEEVCREFQEVSGDRGTLESHWQEVTELILPSYSGLFYSNGQYQTPGEKRTQKQYDSNGAIALSRYAAVVDSLSTPRNQRWHGIVAGRPELMKDRSVRLWTEELTNRLFKYRYAPKANFAGQNQQAYTSKGAFGTGCLFTDELADEPGIRYRAIHLGEIYFFENHQGIIDKAIRRFPMTARQAVQKWGEDKVPSIIKTEYGKNSKRQFWFLHCVKPRAERDSERRDYKGMAFASYYVEQETKTLMSEGGYRTFPYSISRYTQAPGEVYGRSPAMEVLPAIKTLNEEKKTMLKQGQRVVDPVLLAHDDGVVDTFSLKSGAINPGGVNADGRALVHVLPTGNLAAGDKMMEMEVRVINDAFLVTLFQILTETPEMTATEVMERVREKGMLLSPTMGRQQSEYLGPLIERELDVLARQGMLTPMPGALIEAGGEYTVQYDSPLSRAQRAEEAAGLMRTIETALNVVAQSQNPEPLDWFDWDTIMPEIGEIQAVPARWMRSLDQIKIIRQARAKQQQVATAIEAGPAVAGMMKQVA
jgi:hypothetical protein